MKSIGKRGVTPLWLKLMLAADVDYDTGCWNWQRSLSDKGYGQIGIGGTKSERANRASYRSFTGTIPDGMHVLHSCDNPKCVNPDHLFLGTHQDNLVDMDYKGRRHKTITDEQISKAREMRSNGKTIAETASYLGIGQASVSRIDRGIHRSFKPIP